MLNLFKKKPTIETDSYRIEFSKDWKISYTENRAEATNKNISAIFSSYKYNPSNLEVVTEEMNKKIKSIINSYENNEMVKESFPLDTFSPESKSENWYSRPYLNKNGSLLFVYGIVRSNLALIITLENISNKIQAKDFFKQLQSIQWL